MISDHDRRRIALAEHYAREAILLDASGETNAAADAIETANEYLSVLFGRAVNAATSSDVIAYCCRFRETPTVEA